MAVHYNSEHSTGSYYNGNAYCLELPTGFRSCKSAVFILLKLLMATLRTVCYVTSQVVGTQGLQHKTH